MTNGKPNPKCKYCKGSGQITLFVSSCECECVNHKSNFAETIEAIQNILDNPAVRPDSVVALSLSGQMHGSVFLDSDNQIIRNPLLWNDTRTFEECQLITEKIGEKNLLSYVGNPALEGFTLPKVLWMKKNEPDNYKKLSTLMLPKDYIVFMLTSRICTEYSDAAGTLLLDVKNRCWSKEVCEKLDIDLCVLPELLDSTDIVDTLTAQASEATGLPENVKVVAGGADNACSAVGNGIVEEGKNLMYKAIKVNPIDDTIVSWDFETQQGYPD